MTSVTILDFLTHQPMSPSVLLFAYQTGWFPMADGETNEIYWHSPMQRAIFPLHGNALSSSLQKMYKKSPWTNTINNDFSTVIARCAERDDTWISPEIIEIYTELHDQGHAHSIETWDEDQLIGGLYGVSIGSAFFGESMFSLQSNASKHAFVHLYKHLIERNFTLLDSQYINDHTKLLGAQCISRMKYLELLAQAIQHQEVTFFA